MSSAAWLASRSSAEQTRILRQLDDDELEDLEHDWRFWGRPNQLAPEGDWDTWLFLAGRGAGKTRSGAEWIREKVKQGARHIALIAPTTADARKVMVQGESGLLSVCWDGDRTYAGKMMGRPTYEPSNRAVTWGNGAVATTYSAEEPERLRGPQHDTIWADELAAWRYLRETWDMAIFGHRLGQHPQMMISTTPKPLAILREIMSDPRTVITRGSTYDNAPHLAAKFLDRVRRDYEGTRLGRQELFAEILEEAEGALWSREMIEKARHKGALPEMARIVVAVDPAVTDKEESNETGIVAAGLGMDDKGYVLADKSGRYSPAGWAREAIKLYRDLSADRIIAEVNNGGDLVAHTIQTEWKAAPVKTVNAHRGKQARAEPVAALYEQGRVRHAGVFQELEDQLVNWEPLSGMPSPDRLDAHVWAFTELMVGGSSYDPTLRWVA